MPRRTAGALARAASEERDRYVIEAVDRALQLLDLLAANPELGVTEIANRMQISKTLAFRLLHTLEKRDYVARDADRRTTTLGFRILHLADKVERHSLVVGATKQLMAELARRCDEDVNLFVRVGLHSLCVATRPSAHQVRMFPEVGRRLDLHAGGASPILLAYAPEDVRETVLSGELAQITPLTITDPAKLRAQLARIRKQGFHISRGDVDLSAFAVAAPIFGYDGSVAAAICISGPINRLTTEATDSHRAMVIDYANRMSERISGAARRPASA
jgi:IclR family KDG regulon transcriptional repressor